MSNHALALVKLTTLMAATQGRPEIVIGLIDGPVASNQLAFQTENIRALGDQQNNTCIRPDDLACRHGTFVAGILMAKRDSGAPALCPNCTLLVRPIFIEATAGSEAMPNASPQALAEAIHALSQQGVRVLNLSLALV